MIVASAFIGIILRANIGQLYGNARSCDPLSRAEQTRRDGFCSRMEVYNCSFVQMKALITGDASSTG